MHAEHSMLMPGMLTAKQMEALKKAKGAEFDRLFLTGMIQHHNGALIMVKDLFDTAGAGQDAELFNFATDVDSGQRAEIRIMQTMLEKRLEEENIEDESMTAACPVLSRGMWPRCFYSSLCLPTAAQRFNAFASTAADHRRSSQPVTFSNSRAEAKRPRKTKRIRLLLNPRRRYRLE